MEEKVLEEIQLPAGRRQARRELAAVPDPREGDGDLRPGAGGQAGGRAHRRRGAPQGGRDRRQGGDGSRGCSRTSIEAKRIADAEAQAAKTQERVRRTKWHRSRHSIAERHGKAVAAVVEMVTAQSTIAVGRPGVGRSAGRGCHACLVPMAKVEIIGPKNRFFEVVSLVHEQGKLHIEDLTKKIASGEVPLDQMEVVANQQAERDRMEELLIRVRAIIKALHLPGRPIDEAARQKEYLRALEAGHASSSATRSTEVIEEVEDRTSDLASVTVVARGRDGAARALRADPPQDPAAREADRHHRRVRLGRAARRAPLQGRARAAQGGARQDHAQAVRDRVDRRRRGHHGGHRRVQPQLLRAGPQVPRDGEREPDPASLRLPGHAVRHGVRRHPASVARRCPTKLEDVRDELEEMSEHVVPRSSPPSATSSPTRSTRSRRSRSSARPSTRS